MPQPDGRRAFRFQECCCHSRRCSESQRLRSLKFELELDIKKLDAWLGYITEWRNYVSASTPDRFLRYFDLSRVVFYSANNMWATGLLYSYRDHDDMGTLQTLGGEFTLFYENYINNQIAQQKTQFVQRQAVEQIDFWENKFRTHKGTLQDILAKLP